MSILITLGILGILVIVAGVLWALDKQMWDDDDDHFDDQSFSGGL